MTLRRWVLCSLVAVVTLLVLAGCGHVKPYQRQYLSDRIMDPAAARWEMMSERKMLSTREGAVGGTNGNGGGCACN